MLAVDHLQAAYGPAQVLFDICLRVGTGEVVTLLGRNGMGKTTTIRTLMGLLPACGGTAAFEGVSLIGLPPYRIAQAGLGLVPEGRQIFPTLTVEENLIATAASRLAVTRWTLERVYDFFPQLAERRGHMGNELSGGDSSGDQGPDVEVMGSGGEKSGGDQRRLGRQRKPHAFKRDECCNQPDAVD